MHNLVPRIPLPSQPTPGQRFDSWRQARAAICIRRHFDRLSLRRVGMNDPRQGAQANPRADRERESVDHFARMGRYHGSAQNPIGAVSHMYLYEPLLFPIGNRPVNIMHENREGLHGYGFLPSLSNIKTDMGDFWIGIGAPCLL